MLGVIVNAVSIVLGSCLGLIVKGFVTESLAKRAQQALGFCTLIIGIRMALQFQNVLLLIICVVAGGMLGAVLRIEESLEAAAKRLQGCFSGLAPGYFAEGFSTASVLFCTGAMAVVGSINAGVAGNHEVLYAKAALDGIISVSFAAVYGLGVAFSCLPVLLYQGSIAVAASKLKVLSAPAVLGEISGVGGVLVAMIGINLSGLGKVPVADYLPAVLLVMAAAACLASGTPF